MESQDQIDILLGIGILLLLCITLMLVVIFTTYKARILKSEKEKQLIAFRASFEAEEKQKERIANNLHDEIIPLLTVLGQNAELHKRAFKNNILGPDDFDKDARLIEQSIKEIRAVALDLIPLTLLNFGLIRALELYTSQLNNPDRLVELEANISVKELPFSKTTQVNIYRTCLEILNNLQKHAQYSCLRISIENKNHNFKIRFVHDGKGVTNEEIASFTRSSTGLGLKSLNSRLMLLDAEIDYAVENNVPAVSLKIPFST